LASLPISVVFVEKNVRQVSDVEGGVVENWIDGGMDHQNSSAPTLQLAARYTFLTESALRGR
jgi:hypothetical protein